MGADSIPMALQFRPNIYLCVDVGAAKKIKKVFKNNLECCSTRKEVCVFVDLPMIRKEVMFIKEH